MELIDVVEFSKFYSINPIRAQLKYATKQNFVGRVIQGYQENAKNFALLAPRAAEQLCKVQNHLNKNYGYGLLIYDAYRPKQAVLDFLHWVSLPPVNTYELERKAKHYPAIEKNQLFALGYIAEDSEHCYGNTVDLVLFDLQTQLPLPLGTRFDFMGEASHTNASRQQIGEEAYNNRQVLLNAMQLFGFKNYVKEYWHYTYGEKSDRITQVPLDFKITPELKGAGFPFKLIDLRKM